MLARVRHIYGPLALDAIDPSRTDLVDADGAEWTDLGGGPHTYTAEHVGRLGWLAANRESMRAYVAALPEDKQYPARWPSAALDVATLRAGIEAVLAPNVVRNAGPAGEAFELRSDLEAVFAEQGEQDVMLCARELPAGFEPAPSEDAAP